MNPLEDLKKRLENDPRNPPFKSIKEPLFVLHEYTQSCVWKDMARELLKYAVAYRQLTIKFSSGDWDSVEFDIDEEAKRIVEVK